MTDPIRKFSEWLGEAKRAGTIREPTAMCLATATKDGRPSSRMVLLKGVDARGFVFYTNFESRKGEELKANAHAALCFYWDPMGKQVRVEGRAENVSDEEADAYFATRARDSQIGAWASDQSRPLSSRAALVARIAKEAARFLGRDVPRPPHWSGWRIVPERIEFWQNAEHRLHDREVFTRTGAAWESSLLFP